MPSNLVSFVYAASATPEQIAAFDANTIYFVGASGSGTGGRLYKGPRLYDAGTADVVAELTILKSYIGTLPVDEQYDDLIDYIDTIVAEAAAAGTGAASTLEASLSDVAKSGEAEDVTIADTSGNFASTNVEDALQELYSAIGTGGTNAAVTITKTTGGANDSYAYRYTFSQGGSTINNGIIDIGKDMVATNGELVHPTAQNPITINGQSVTSGTYIAMTIANGDPFYINVADLIEYNSVSSTNEITLTDTNHTITASVGKIAASKIIYREADSSVSPAVTEQTVAQAINALESAVGSGGSVDTKISNAINALDGSVSAASGSVITGITQTDGVITTATTTALTAQNVSYGTSNVKAALDTIGTIPSTSTASTVVDYIDEKTGAGIEALDATVSATLSGTQDTEAVAVVTSVTQTDGLLTAVGSAAADAAGAATRAKAAVIGSSGDAATASTIYGAKAYADNAASAAINALDAVVTASGTALASGTFVVSGITEANGIITSVTSTEVENAGAAAAAETAAKSYTDTLLTWGTLS